MLTFSCKEISKEDLVRCSFVLNKTEYNLLVFLLEYEKKHTILQISKRMNFDRTTIQKAMKTLVNKRLVKRTQKNLKNGGYIFQYAVDDKEKIKQEMRKIIQNWYRKIEESIRTL